MKINIGKNEISYEFRNRIIFVNNDTCSIKLKCSI